jgi:cytochrome c oxidase subunit 2
MSRVSLFAALLLGLAGSPPAGTAGQSAGEPRVIDVVVKRFAFEPAEIEATVGERLRLVIKSADGVHGLEIKKFKVSKSIPRGSSGVTVDFAVTEEGRFPILCSEYCGDGHDDMRGTLVVKAQ